MINILIISIKIKILIINFFDIHKILIYSNIIIHF